MTNQSRLGNDFTKLFLFLTSIFIAALIVSNIIAVKLISIGPLVLPAAVMVFPIIYIFGDILTEVYGYRRARLVIWLGFLANLIVVVFIIIGQILPAVGFWKNQDAYETILGFVPRILSASFVAYLAGEFLNSYVLSRIKIATNGRFLWIRTISSTIVGQLVDSGLFITIAFVGVVNWNTLIAMLLAQWLFKVVYEVVLTPVTYLVVRWIKRAENIDVYDTDVDYNPLRVLDTK